MNWWKKILGWNLVYIQRSETFCVGVFVLGVNACVTKDGVQVAP